jgi:hypothetical protein
MKKIYTIRISQKVQHHQMWYAGKAGTEFTAELSARAGADYKQVPVVFMVNPCQWVYPVDCTIVSEQLTEIYTSSKNKL